MNDNNQTDQRFVKLRTILHKTFTKATWVELLSLFKTWPKKQGFDIALSYAIEHLEKVPTQKRVVPDLWLKRLLSPTKKLPKEFPLATNLDIGKADVILEEGEYGYLDYEDDFEVIEQSGAEKLAKEPLIHSIKQMRLGYQRIGDEGLRALLESPNISELEYLDLRYNQISDIGLKMMARSDKLRHLRTLHLQYNQITAKGIKEIANSPTFQHLTTLDLRFNPIREEGAKYLADSRVLTNLKKLMLQTSDLGKEGIQLLANSKQLDPVISSYWRNIS